MPEKERKVSRGTSMIDSPIGKRAVDTNGSAIAGVRLDASMAYFKIPELLQTYINENDTCAWTSILDRIDYIYENLDYALSQLNKETEFGDKVQAEIMSGKKLLFKPNFVNPQIIDSVTHGEGMAAIINTEWPFIAAIMRWFHDKLDINYSKMAFGEASCVSFVMSASFTKLQGRTITTEAVFEGRSGDFYGGGGFYFVRKYLKSHCTNAQDDDPMNGYEESVTGTFFPPGKTGNRLMVYDLNKLGDDLSRVRTVKVPGGVNFKEITLHKVVIGGNLQDMTDITEYPGCVLVNIPKIKMHAQDLITNAIKNIGIGLYPVELYEVSNPGYPSLRTKLPHSPWIFTIDEHTRMPIRDQNGEYIVTKTAGMPGTQTDVIKAVQSQKVFMIHISDAINMINISHNADGRSVRVPEGYVWASLDCVALDLFCARYCFKTIPMIYGIRLKRERNLPTEFIRQVPVATVNGNNIGSDIGLDSPLFRYDLYEYANKRGIGRLEYYVTGLDTLTNTPLASIKGHLGRIENYRFTELMTQTQYYNYNTVLHDLQTSILSYAKACDRLTKSSLYKEYMDTYDENKDGIIVYDEQGLGFETVNLMIQADTFYLPVTQPYGFLKQSFLQPASQFKYANKSWNKEGHDFLKEGLLASKTEIAYRLSQSKTVRTDHFYPRMFYGNGMWPSWQTVTYILITNSLYGSQSPKDITLGSMYGTVFQYADKVLNSGAYTIHNEPFVHGPSPYQYGNRYLPPMETTTSDKDAIPRYFKAISKGAPLLNFILYVPNGYGKLEGMEIPNVIETSNPADVFTVHYNEAW